MEREGEGWRERDGRRKGERGRDGGMEGERGRNGGREWEGGGEEIGKGVEEKKGG